MRAQNTLFGTLRITQLADSEAEKESELFLLPHPSSSTTITNVRVFSNVHSRFTLTFISLPVQTSPRQQNIYIRLFISKSDLFISPHLIHPPANPEAIPTIRYQIPIPKAERARGVFFLLQILTKKKARA